MQYCRDEPEDNVLTDSETFKFKLRFRNNTNNDVDLKIAVPLKCKVNFWRTLETLYSNYSRATTFAITDSKRNIPFYQFNIYTKLLQQLKSGLTGINTNIKHQRRHKRHILIT